MTKANVNVKIDAKTKEQATALLVRMGLDQTTAIEMFFRQIIAEHRLPFQPIAAKTLDEQIAAAAIGKSGKVVVLSTNQDGNIQIDKKMNPEIYDWAVNG